jgi:tetratricopeptide (TPR) repeat protein
MNPIKRLCLIIAVALTMDAFIIAPAFPQQGEAARPNARVMALYRARKFAEAVPLAQRALAIGENALGPNHPDVAASLADLATLYDGQGRYADAKPLHERALAIREKTLGPGHPDVALTAPPLFRVRAILFAGRFGNQVFDSAERVRVTAAPLCSGAGPEAWRGAVVPEDGGIACDAGAPAGADYTSACWTGIDRRRLLAIHHGSVSADYCERLTPLIRAIERGKIRFRRSGPRDVAGRCVRRYATRRI